MRAHLPPLAARHQASTLLRLTFLFAALTLGCTASALAQISQLATPQHGAPISREQPVTFTADQVQYDREHGLVTAIGHVEAWQNDHVVRADKITFDRNTNVAAAYGHVVLLEPDGQVLFADYAEMTEGMRNAVLRGMRAILAQNGKLAANGARRTEGQINELSKVVYTACNLCKTDPTKPPLWQIRALSAVQDLVNKRIEYWDATMQMFGMPVGWLPYFSQPDPSVKRASGFLIPDIGYNTHLGAFLTTPYYLVLDDQSDVTLTPILTTHAGESIDVDYRRRFNDGTIRVNAQVGYFEGEPQDTIYATGRFNYDDTWRYGFDIQRASNVNYATFFNLNNPLGASGVLTSQVYLEGFGNGAYTRLDARIYQGLLSNVITAELPVVMPRYEYSFVSDVDPLGGRLSVDTQDFNILRQTGTNTQRGSLTLNWNRPFVGQLGDLWALTLHLDAAAYHASDFNLQPNFGTHPNVDPTRALPQVSLDWRWPFLRDSGAWGSQLIEPHVQLVMAPIIGNSQFNKVPNEDSLDIFEFTDQNLFGFNRFPGIDRLDGGIRVNYALHGAWYLNGQTFDGMIGQSYRTTKDNNFPEYTGLQSQVSDIVARATFQPTTWLDLTYRTRLQHDTLQDRFSDLLATVSVWKLNVSGGYIYTTNNPYTFYDQAPPPPAGSPFFLPRNELSLGLSGNFGQYRFSVFARRNLALNQNVFAGGNFAYENECLIVNLQFNRRFTSFNGDSGSSGVLLTVTFKTLGAVGYRVM
jgi:LPS-assembly protein